MFKLIMAVVAAVFLVGCGSLYEYSPKLPHIVPRSEWSEFYGHEYFFNRDEYIEALFESAYSVTTRWEDSWLTTMHIVVPHEHELVQPRFDISEKILINGEVIDAPAPIWKHLALGSRFIGHYQGAEVFLEVMLPRLMIPLRGVAEALGYYVTWDEESGEIMIGRWITLGGSYRLQLGEREGYCIDLGWRFFMEAEPVVYDGMIFVSPCLFQPHGAQVFDSQLVIDSYSLNRSGEIVIGITLATDDSLANYDTFAEFIEIDREAASFQKIIIAPNMPLYDFRWFEIGHGMEDFYFYNIDIHEVGEVSSTRPFLVSWHPGGTFPHKGISFVDYNGVTRYFSLNTNEASFGESPRGRYVLIEFMPGVPWSEFWEMRNISALATPFLQKFRQVTYTAKKLRIETDL